MLVEVEWEPFRHQLTARCLQTAGQTRRGHHEDGGQVLRGGRGGLSGLVGGQRGGEEEQQ